MEVTAPNNERNRLHVTTARYRHVVSVATRKSHCSTEVEYGPSLAGGGPQPGKDLAAYSASSLSRSVNIPGPVAYWSPIEGLVPEIGWRAPAITLYRATAIGESAAGRASQQWPRNPDDTSRRCTGIRPSHRHVGRARYR